MKPGDQFEAKIGFDKLNEAERLNGAAGAHLWITTATYGLTDEEAEQASEGSQVLLDREHLLALPGIGCWICEKPYEDAVKDTRCKGNPVRYSERGEPCYRDGTTASGGRWQRA